MPTRAGTAAFSHLLGTEVDAGFPEARGDIGTCGSSREPAMRIFSTRLPIRR
jgi:hypothetical protein